MKKFHFILSLFALISVEAFAQVKLYIGTYTDTKSKGIYSAMLDTVEGTLSQILLEAETDNPSYLAFSADKKYLYAVQETNYFNGKQSGALSAFRVEGNGNLKLINTVSTEGAHPCHIAVNPVTKWVSVTNYSGGNISLFRPSENGGLTEATQVISHQGNGPRTDRQEAPHPHSSQFTSDGHLLLTADLGNDKLAVYSWQNESFREVPKMTLQLPGGNGPRHFAQTADGHWIYVLNELSSTLNVLEKKENDLVLVNEISTVSSSFKGQNYGADIHLSKDEQFLYVSNRGENSIAVFQRLTNGAVAYLGFVNTRGNWPRNFTLDPTGKFLLVANQLSDNISVFRIGENGIPHFTSEVQTPRPVCLLFE